jgi:hypothetical protein
MKHLPNLLSAARCRGGVSKACAAILGEMDGIREITRRIGDQFDYILCKNTLPSRFQAWQGKLPVTTTSPPDFRFSGEYFQGIHSPNPILFFWVFLAWTKH